MSERCSWEGCSRRLDGWPYEHDGQCGRHLVFAPTEVDADARAAWERRSYELRRGKRMVMPHWPGYDEYSWQQHLVTLRRGGGDSFAGGVTSE